jgi:DNA-binding response OmpR family regulator
MFVADLVTPDELASPKIKILLAEDDSSIRRFIEVILQRANYEVLAAEDGLSAMKLALSNNVDAIIADAMMPNLGGYDLCRMLRQNPLFKDVPFFILSGLEKDHFSDSECRIDAYILKGTNLKERLLETVSKFLVQKAVI